MFVLFPDSVVMALFSVAGSMEAVIDAEDKDEEPGQDGQSFVDDQRAAVMRLSPCERVHWPWESCQLKGPS